MKKHGWVFTLNNYHANEIPMEFISEPYSHYGLLWDNPHIGYVGCGKEVASTGTPHLQGLVVFKRSVGLKSLKKLNERAHWQPMRGTFEEAYRYCSKDGKFLEWIDKGFTKKECKLKVEEDHIQAKVIADENDNIEALSKALYRQSEDIKSLTKSLNSLVELNKHMLLKLNTSLSKDKYV